MNIGQRMAARAKPRHVVVGASVFEVRPPTTAKLVENGFTSLVGAAEAQGALDEARVEEEALLDAFDNGTPLRIEEAKQESLKERLRKQLELLKQIQTDPKRQVEFGSQMHAYIAAGVQRLGVLVGTVPPEDGEEAADPPDWWEGETHRELMPDGWDPAPFVAGGALEVVHVFAQEPEPRPGETVTDAAERLARRRQIWVGLLSPVECSTLFHAIRTLAGGRARSVAGFRLRTHRSAAA